MSENNEGGAFAAASSGKSPEEIAFELVNKLKGQGVWGERNMTAILDMYAECLDAAKGLRTYAGQNRIDLPIKGREQSQIAMQDQRSGEAAKRLAAAQLVEQHMQSQSPAPQKTAATQPAQHVQPGTQQALSPQPTVQQQQQVLHQAYKQS